jgi:hypothetical protein
MSEGTTEKKEKTMKLKREIRVGDMIIADDGREYMYLEPLSDGQMWCRDGLSGIERILGRDELQSVTLID